MQAKPLFKQIQYSWWQAPLLQLQPAEDTDDYYFTRSKDDFKDEAGLSSALGASHPASAAANPGETNVADFWDFIA